MDMTKARSAHRAECTEVAQTVDADSGSVVGRKRVLRSGSPSFRTWARARFKRAQANMSPKLARIVGAA